MFKGFGKPKDDSIWIESLVKSRSLEPAVNLRWGKKEAQLTSQEAIAHAFGILEAAAAAEIDSCFVRWAVETLNLSPTAAMQVLQVFRQKRETDSLPSCTMNLGNGEHIRPDTARNRAKYLLHNAFSIEMEAFLIMFIIQDLERSPEVADQIVQEFRAFRGLQTDWSHQGEDGDRTSKS